MQKYLVFMTLGAILAQGVTQYFQSDRLTIQSQRIDLLQERLDLQSTSRKEIDTILSEHSALLALINKENTRSSQLHHRTQAALEALQQQCREQAL